MPDNRAGGGSSFPSGGGAGTEAGAGTGTGQGPFQAASAAAMPARLRFYIELKPGETTIVSWKKLVKELQRPALNPPPVAPAGAHPALESRIAPETSIAPEVVDPLPPPCNRFNSVIEKIERLYRGVNSDDENENGCDYQDDDKYDTRDSFIDDEELDDYFSVENANLKHKGFFVNRGKLEQEIEPAPVTGPKKRKRKDIKKLNTEAVEDTSKKLKSGVRLKAAARKVLLSSVTAVSEAAAFNSHKTLEQEGLLNRISGNEMEERVCSKDLALGDINKTQTKDATKEGPQSLACQQDVVEVSIRHSLSTDRSLDKSDVRKPGGLPVDQKTTDMVKANAVQKNMKDEDTKDLMGAANKLGNAKLSSSAAKDASPGRSKGTALERAFQELEKEVAQVCPPSLVAREPEQGKRNRLPRDIKQKLAKVARLAQAKQGKVTDELVERLMGVLGHMVRVKTLKRNLKSMIEMGLSAMQEKEGRLQDIKREVIEMIKSRVHNLQAQDAEQRNNQSNDFQPMDISPEKAIGDGRYQWDHATEDKICDLYEQYVEGMDENRGPHIRKLYAELAELWPDGWMDNVGVKHAVHRAKERKKKQIKASNSVEPKKRVRSTGKQKVDDLWTERVLMLQTNASGQDQCTYDRMGFGSHEKNEMHVNHDHELLQSTDDKKKLARKSGGIERKKAKEVSPLAKPNPEGAMDTALGVFNKSGLTQGFLASPTPPALSSASPVWKVDRQTGTVLPVIE